MTRPPLCSSLFPYTTLFRSVRRLFFRNWLLPPRPCWRMVRCCAQRRDRKSTRLNTSHVASSVAIFCVNNKLKKKINEQTHNITHFIHHRDEEHERQHINLTG